MSFEVARSAVVGLFHSLWNPVTLPIVYENQANPPDVDGPWGRFVVLQGGTDPMEIGRESTRGIGFAILQVFLPEGSGTKLATDCAGLMAGIFDRRTINVAPTYVVFMTTSLEDAGNRQGYIQKIIRVQFRRDTLE